MLKINQALLNHLFKEASINPRKRINHNFHSSYDDPVQRMLNCIEPGSYFRPHKHSNPPKREVFIILQGKAIVIQFDDNGNITDQIILNPKTRNYGVEIPENTFHTLVILKPTVVYELKDGPYSPIDDKDFANWAPATDDEHSQKYIQSLMNQLNL